MKVVIADGTPVGWKRVKNLISGIPDVRLIGTAENPGDLIDLLERHSPDVLILDIEISGRNGIPLLRSIVGDYPAMKVIVLTNASGPVYRRKCQTAGASYFFDKSTEFHQIALVIGELLRSGAASITSNH